MSDTLVLTQPQLTLLRFHGHDRRPHRWEWLDDAGRVQWPQDRAQMAAWRLRVHRAEDGALKCLIAEGADYLAAHDAGLIDTLFTLTDAGRRVLAAEGLDA